MEEKVVVVAYLIYSVVVVVKETNTILYFLYTLNILHTAAQNVSWLTVTGSFLVPALNRLLLFIGDEPFMKHLFTTTD